MTIPEPAPATAGGAAGFIAPGPATAEVVQRMMHLADLVRDAGRDDLTERLGVVHARLRAVDVPVAVLGEFKQGKSSLVNALVRTEVCPVDPDLGTAVPTSVRWGRPPRALAQERGGDGTATVTVPLDRLEQLVTERGRTRRPPLESVQVLLDRSLLRTGLVLVDTPGLGGLDSADGVAALAVLPQARGVIYATTAAQELAATEVAYLQHVVRRCPAAVVAVTMTDLHLHWREVLDRDREHLAAAGLDLPVVAVSSFLRMRADATGDDALHARSGFPELLRFLGGRVLRVADQERAAVVSTELQFLEAQLRGPVQAERQVLQDPASAATVVRRLETGVHRTERLASPAAGWQVALLDGSQDLMADVEHDLRQRLLILVRKSETRIDEGGDPRESWDEVAAWLRVEAVRAAVANLHLLVDRADRLLREVAEHFDGEVGELDIHLPLPEATLQAVPEAQVPFIAASRNVLGLLTAARVVYGGALVGGIGGAVLLTASASVLAPVGALVGVALARRIIRADKERELHMHRDTAKRELRRFVDEVGFLLAKDSRDAVRRTQRLVRDELTDRAALVHRSATEALTAAREAAALSPAERVHRARDLEQRWRNLAATPPRTDAVAPGPGEG